MTVLVETETGGFIGGCERWWSFLVEVKDGDLFGGNEGEGKCLLEKCASTPMLFGIVMIICSVCFVCFVCDTC